MATFDNIDTKDINQLTNSEFVDYADNDVVIIDDLRNFSKLQTIKLDFLLIIVVKSGRVAMKATRWTPRLPATTSSSASRTPF